ncbi:hypothetical protein BOTBODRAFT_49846 [Botryobasidium botryosum FD-172 SS1]|uniref:Carbohydrate-binding module family 13 protein n=1 Tax=Botryobasidium botryosum (strain FD-172 SS1) TaxID=930990 RepID=A0A067NAI3_BOTB1|nr:hypothetical protein BOTBODRAFT_49846 [Botryobasidium botryosum FD-172 SS1]
MALLLPGEYRIHRGACEAALLGYTPGALVAFYRPSLHPDLRKWHVQPQHNGTYTLQNIKTGDFLAYYEKENRVGGSPCPCQWRIEHGPDPSQYFLMVPASPFVVDARESCFTVQTHLVLDFLHDKKESTQAWTFTPCSDS